MSFSISSHLTFYIVFIAQAHLYIFINMSQKLFIHQLIVIVVIKKEWYFSFFIKFLPHTVTSIWNVLCEPLEGAILITIVEVKDTKNWFILITDIQKKLYDFDFYFLILVLYFYAFLHFVLQLTEAQAQSEALAEKNQQLEAQLADLKERYNQEVRHEYCRYLGFMLP